MEKPLPEPIWTEELGSETEGFDLDCSVSRSERVDWPVFVLFESASVLRVHEDCGYFFERPGHSLYSDSGSVGWIFYSIFVWREATFIQHFNYDVDNFIFSCSGWAGDSEDEGEGGVIHWELPDRGELGHLRFLGSRLFE